MNCDCVYVGIFLGVSVYEIVLRLFSWQEGDEYVQEIEAQFQKWGKFQDFVFKIGEYFKVREIDNLDDKMCGFFY